MNVYFNLQFNYCQFVRKCHSHTSDNKTNKLCEQCFRLIYCGQSSTFQYLLHKYGPFSILRRNIQTLRTEMCKIANYIPKEFTKKIYFYEGIGCDLRYQINSIRPYLDTESKLLKSYLFLGNKIWEIIPQNIKTLEYLNSFKKEIREWKPDDWPYTL